MVHAWILWLIILPLKASQIKFFLQERERVDRESVVREKVAASTFARGYLNGLMDTVFNKLDKEGYFYDPVQREVETEFMPWLRYESAKIEIWKAQHPSKSLLSKAIFYWYCRTTVIDANFCRAQLGLWQIRDLVCL